jgi:hypothetical protein
MKLSSTLITSSCVLNVFASSIMPRSGLFSRNFQESADEFDNRNTCKPAYLVFAKGSLSFEFGNLVSLSACEPVMMPDLFV